MTALADYKHAPRVRRALEAIARVACPPEIEELQLVSAVVDHMELSMRSLPDLVRTALVTGITSYDMMAALVPANRGRRASSLDYDGAHAYFLSWKDSPIGLQREFIKGVKGLLCMSYYEQAAVKERIDYRPEQWIEEVTRHRLTTYAEPIETQRKNLITPDPMPLSELFPDSAKASDEEMQS